jgi:hypothetical protein
MALRLTRVVQHLIGRTMTCPTREGGFARQRFTLLRRLIQDLSLPHDAGDRGIAFEEQKPAISRCSLCQHRCASRLLNGAFFRALSLLHRHFSLPQSSSTPPRGWQPVPGYFSFAQWPQICDRHHTADRKRTASLSCNQHREKSDGS